MGGRNFLIVAHKGHFFEVFLKNNMALLQELGYTVYCAGSFAEAQDARAKPVLEAMGAIALHIDIQRSPYSWKNVRAYRQLKSLMKRYGFAAVHCHTPTGGALGRLAARKFRRVGTKVFYTAHGFHFFKGAPLKNWILYYTVEKLCARWTDVLITINREDYIRAQRFRAKRVCHVPGVGIDTDRFRPLEKNRADVRRELGYGDSDFVLLSIGELIPRKNHALVLRALALLNAGGQAADIRYLICGQGALEAELKALAEELGIAKMMRFPGYRSDIPELCSCSDLFVFMSLQEGLPVALMEAMSCGMPVICSNIRGNADLVHGGISGEVIGNDVSALADAILRLKRDPERCARYGAEAMKAVRRFDLKIVQRMMREIYSDI